MGEEDEAPVEPEAGGGGGGGSGGGGGGEDESSGAAGFDAFSMYFTQFIIFAVWVVYVIPIFGNILDDKPLELRSKFRNGWNYIIGRGRKAVKIKETE